MNNGNGIKELYTGEGWGLSLSFSYLSVFPFRACLYNYCLPLQIPYFSVLNNLCLLRVFNTYG